MTSHSNTRVYLGPVHMKFVVEKVAMGQFLFLLFHLSPVSIIPPTLHTHIIVIRKKSGRSMGTSNKELFFRISRSTG